MKTGVREGGKIEIIQGLKPNQRVVSEGVAKLSDGMAIRLARPTGARPQREAR